MDNRGDVQTLGSVSSTQSQPRLQIDYISEASRYDKAIGAFCSNQLSMLA